jgi:putative colanic acid biosynthesis UDP-glucose lipid carrier transferase
VEDAATQTISTPVTGHAQVADSILKRGLDILGALMLLVLFAPTMLLAAIAVKITSKGPVLFRQQRTGLNGKTFEILKYRSMTVLENGDEVRQASRGDKRVTAVGALLRRSSFDELPQLINVLRGDMSLIGPRPHALAHDRYYGARLPGYVLRFRTRPGISGLAQIRGARGETVDVSDMKRRIDLDNQYVDEWSFVGDLKILIMTVLIVPFQSAY